MEKQKEMTKNIRESQEPFVVYRFGQGQSPMVFMGLASSDLKTAHHHAIQRQHKSTIALWPYVYVARSGFVVANAVGPDLVGASVEFAQDFFQTYQPVHEDISKGDSI